MKKTRDEMLTDIIRKWGFENAATITFATLMDDTKISERALYEAYRGFMSLQALFLLSARGPPAQPENHYTTPLEFCQQANCTNLHPNSFPKFSVLHKD